jgi:DnaJ-class molecular chaperone
MLAVLLLLAALVAAGAWYVDVRRRPWKPCPWCGGRKRTRGSRPTAYGKFTCRHCGGKGEVRRVGAGRER